MQTKNSQTYGRIKMNNISVSEALTSPDGLYSERTQLTPNSIEKMLCDSLNQVVIDNPRTGKSQIVACASTGNESESHFATPFCRDGCMFLIWLLKAVEHGREDLEPHLLKAMTALEELEKYQLTEDDPEVCAKTGQLPHELRFPFHDKEQKEPNDIFQAFIKAQWKIFKDGTDEKYIASYDSSEATHLYVLTVMLLERKYPGFASEGDRPEKLKLACEYILKNSEEHNHLAGFTNNLPLSYLREEEKAYGCLDEIEKDPSHPSNKRIYRGAAFKEIRDQGDQCFLNGLKPKPGCPISGLETTAIKFAAEKTAADYYQKIGDGDYAARLREDARLTKINFNDKDIGFLRLDENSKPYFVEARGTNPETALNEQLPYKTASPIYALAYCYENIGADGAITHESVIDNKYIPDVVRLITQELFQPGLGMSTYSPFQIVPTPRDVLATDYWISAGRTFWGVEQYTAAIGLLNVGEKDKALEIAQTADRILTRFGSPLENWLKGEDGKAIKWRHPHPENTLTEDSQASGNTMAFVVAPGLGFWAKFQAAKQPTLPAHMGQNRSGTFAGLSR